MDTTLRLAFTPPYDWPEIHGYLAGRAMPGIEQVTPGAYARTIALNGLHGTVSVCPDADALVATIRFPDPAALPVIVGRLRNLFDLDADPAAIGAALARDPFMARLVAARPGLRVPGAWDGFELAVRAILGQQISVGAATRLAGRLAAALGTPLAGSDAEPGLTHVFPSPERLAEADIAAILRMPRARGAAISTLAAAVAAAPDLFAPGQGLETAVARLTALRGIGDWTARYIAMRVLREPDALPAADVGLLRALDEGRGRPTPAELLLRSAAWQPWRSYAVLHLWASLAPSGLTSPTASP